MGACYSVRADLMFEEHDSKGWCETIRRMRDDLEAKGEAHFAPYTVTDENSPLQWFEAVTTNYCEERDGAFYADFSASYGWWSVMVDIFTEAIKQCDDDSEIVLEMWGEGAPLIITPNGSRLDEETYEEQQKQDARLYFEDIYTQYYREEFNGDPKIDDGQTEFGVMYTTTEDEEHELQVTYYTDTMRSVYYVDDEEVWHEDFESLELMAEDIEGMDFQLYYEWVMRKGREAGLIND